MSRCNCDCVFCCVRDEIARSQDIDLNYLKERIVEHPSETIIDFFGGEPTLYPYFIEALSFARGRGHKCRIATNGRIFSNLSFAKRVIDLGIDQIRTSVYGHTAQLHDFHTSSSNSFNQTIQGIKNLIDLEAELFVNTVITSENVRFLPEIVDLLYSFGVKNIKFGSLTDCSHVLDLVPDPEVVRLYLKSALQRANEHGMSCAIEKSPLCLLPEHYEIFAYEPDDFLYRKPDICADCIGENFCVGFPKEQVHKYGSEIAHPIKLNDNEQFIPEDVLIAEIHEFVSWDDQLETSITVIAKVSGMCNLSCDYCYAARNFSTNSLMSDNVLNVLSKELADFDYKRIDFNWHGGEPLIAKRSFYEHAIGLQIFYGLANDHRVVVNRLQTNGTLINAEWIDLFKNLDLDVGVSLDGPEIIQNAHRVFLNGKGSYNQIQKSIKLLAANQVPIELLCVITHESIPYAAEIYSFFSRLADNNPGLIESANFMPSFEVKQGTRELLPLTISPDEYSQFMITVFDLWFSEDNPSFSIVFFEEIITVLLGGKATLCHLKRGCNSFITVEPSGDVYPCDRFAGLQEFYLGNLLKDSLDTIFHSENRREYANAVFSNSPLCVNCEWFRLCHGGCLYESYAHTKQLGQPTFYCDGLKKIYQHIDNLLRVYVDGYKRFVNAEV